MSLFIDEKFLNEIAHHLRNYRKKANFLWNFSCPLCGDSQKKKLRARGYVYRSPKYQDRLSYKCHNCGCLCSLGTLIKQMDADVYKQYVYESYLEKGLTPPASKKEDSDEEIVKKHQKKKEKQKVKPLVLVGCPAISTLGPDHPAREYLEWRKLPLSALKELYWTDDFPALVDRFIPGNQFSLAKEGRIIIPFYNRAGEIVTLQGRSQPRFDPLEKRWVDSSEAIRYITVKSEEDSSRVFGMDRISFVSSERIYVLEGPFDSLFLPNCIAMAGSDLPLHLNLPLDRTVVVYDNERLKPNTITKIEKAIEHGFKVCIWPDDIEEKDVNNMVIAGYTPKKIREIIDKNTYSGLTAKLKLQGWANPKGNPRKGNVTSIIKQGHNS